MAAWIFLDPHPRVRALRLLWTISADSQKESFICLPYKPTSSKLFSIFARFGVLFSLRRGNGPQLILEDLESFFRMHDNWASQSYTVVATRQQWGWTPESFTAWILAGCTWGEDQLAFRINLVVDCLIHQPLKSLLLLHLLFGRETFGPETSL